jgi:pimeloyl-ACP methyl ester carboxylesterase
MDRPRLLLVSEFTELEWAIKPLLEEWAEVVSFDLPGIGAEPLPTGVSDVGELTRQLLVERGLEKLDEAGWKSFVLVADGWGIATAVGIATSRRDAVAAMALGHARLSSAREGERAPINAEVYEAFTQLVKQDAPSFVRYGIAQVTKGGVDETRAQQIIDRIPTDFMIDGWAALTADEAFGGELLTLDCPLLLAKHEGCLMSTDEGFEDAVAALPHAETAACDDPPAASHGFAEALRGFCERHWSAASSRPHSI